MLETCFEEQRSDTLPPELAKTTTTTSELRVGEQARLRTRIKADDIADGAFLLAVPYGSEKVVIGRYPVDLDKDPLDCEFDGTWLSIGNATQRLWACITSYDDIYAAKRIYLVCVPVLYQSANGTREREISLFFTVSYDQEWKFVSGRYMYAYAYSRHGPVQVTPEPGGKIRPLHFAGVERGKLERRASKESFIVGAGGVEITERPLPPGEYLLGFQVTDFSGNTVYDMVKIKLKR